MSSPYLGEIKIFPFGFAPKNWVQCNGQTLPINQFQALFALLGTTYGGNGTTTFNLPNLQGNVAVHFGVGFAGTFDLGQEGGEANHTLTDQEIPSHTHSVRFAKDTTQLSPKGHYWAPDTVGNVTFATAGGTALSPQAISSAGSTQAHPNMQPYLVLNFCIAMAGIFPSRN
jgi:microcystin-dependent protein